MRIEQFSDEHGIYVRASEEAFLVTKEQAASIREYIDRLRELVRHLYTCMERQEPDGSLLCANCPYENESNECDYEQRMEELGVDA